jgi:hypothetical protein|tara:strand:+ start:684 stop:1187 length:504 start_codon:yes stop_codon:yes gene_type:complete
MTDAPNTTWLDIARARLVVHQAGQVRACLDALNDGQIWWRANEGSNSIGNLVLHLSGSTRWFIGHGVGDSGFVRDRDAEFAEQGPMPKEGLLAHLDFAVSEADRVLSEFDPARLHETADRIDTPITYEELILNQVLHFTTHAGQVVFATKLIQQDLIHEVWKSTPKS